MQEQFFEQLRGSISSHRLDAYRVPGDSDFDVIAKYLWNTELCESLYPALQTLEIVLRNSLHAAASARFRTEFWFDPPTSRLAPEQQGAVAYAKAELQKKRKPVEAGRVVTELTFGFWTSLFNTRYERIFWPYMLLPTFPGMPRTIRTRQTASRRLNEIRDLRNRIFHHERISHWVDLGQKHGELIEAVGWISADWQRLLVATDQFPGALGAGMERVRHKLSRAIYGEIATM